MNANFCNLQSATFGTKITKQLILFQSSARKTNAKALLCFKDIRAYKHMECFRHTL